VILKQLMHWLWITGWINQALSFFNT